MASARRINSVLRKAYSSLSCHPNINYGGCGVVAEHIARHLQKFTECRIRIISEKAATADIHTIITSESFSNSSWGWLKYNIEFQHIVVQYKVGRRWYGFDCSVGPCEWSLFAGHFTRYRFVDGSVPIDILHELNCDKRNWNSDFDRTTIAKVVETIDQHMQVLCDE